MRIEATCCCTCRCNVYHCTLQVNFQRVFILGRFSEAVVTGVCPSLAPVDASVFITQRDRRSHCSSIFTVFLLLIVKWEIDYHGNALLFWNATPHGRRRSHLTESFSARSQEKRRQTPIVAFKNSNSQEHTVIEGQRENGEGCTYTLKSLPGIFHSCNSPASIFRPTSE